MNSDRLPTRSTRYPNSGVKNMANSVMRLERKPPYSRVVLWASMKNLMAKVWNGKIAE